MNFKKIDFFYFIGIGGMGMSSIARYFHTMGKTVCGHDQNKTFLTKELEKEGISINYHDSIEILPKWVLSKQCLIVYTPAIPSHHKQWMYLKKYGKNVKKRSQVLAFITENEICIAIGGTHGKTTTCTLLGHILYSSGMNVTAFLGGISENYKSNLILNHVLNGRKIFLVEADEFDHSFLYLSPNIACITSFDQDHIDTYPRKETLKKAYIAFSNRIKKPYKKIFLCREESCRFKNAIYYSVLQGENYYSDHLYIKENKWYFDFHTPTETWKSLPLPIPGQHNLKNVTAALAISDYLKISKKEIRKALFLFKGIKRRYSIHYQSSNKIYIDDYAHHPTEINALISTVRECFPNKKILGIFQPHLFSRTKFFETSFAKSLEYLDILILLDIYPAREFPKNGTNSNSLLEKIKMSSKEISTLSKVLEKIEKKHFDIILTMGAGNIESLILPIKEWLYKRYG
ncbi:UDP-N-acetylmuramate--L-alanine ligase [Blattabacterium cuenoti]|mgnify:CR=1 FL=1|uniref:UDP-N-acetylmuramate--L-alanine ligase n=1 Tax=Blattabacterium cuenoti BPAY TaxID=1457031 RepID=A0ABN5V480_9FLAO|nr:UDP-N-acetylmuramate--L-alanine ligase [Blattabacterium cuenoti]BAR92010.1 UDP-N-acetylmuramate--L-alanine ligase [Blattabacterium cuenoti BPAY]